MDAMTLDDIIGWKPLLTDEERTIRDSVKRWVTDRYIRVEDPYLWTDRNGNWHLFAHRYDYSDGWPPNPNQSEPEHKQCPSAGSSADRRRDI